MSGLPVYYHGRNWDAPMTDDAVLMPEDLAEALLNGEAPQFCDFCTEQLCVDDDVLVLPYIKAHLECHLRSGMGDVQHLEGRCLCDRGAGNEIVHDSDLNKTYRQEAKATLQWLLDNRRGRFHP